MNGRDYQTLAARTLIEKPEEDIPPEQLMIVWHAMGLAGEAGEVVELAKKGIFHHHGIDVEKFKKELGDVLWYVAALCTNLNLDIAEVMEQNIDKLQIRYPNGFSSHDSKRRVDRMEHD